jgi:mevalonate kinase
VRSKKKVAGENALIMFTYNFKRLLNLIGIALFRKLMIAIKDRDIESIRKEKNIIDKIAKKLKEHKNTPNL